MKDLQRRQFLVLYRDFLFRIVDRELLSTYAKGDASQLLLQLVALLAFVSVCCAIPALALHAMATGPARLMFVWSVEHFLVATTMLVVGIFAVLSWESLFPSQRDMLVLGPLPIRAQTILFAKLAAVITTLSLAILTLHVVAGLAWPLALRTPGGGVAAGLRLIGAYWATMFAAGAFVFGVAISVQGIAAALLPRRHFLRMSSFLQLGLFCLIVGGYFLQPIAVRPGIAAELQQHGLLALSPSYWFLGLFQGLSGSTTLAPLAQRAWIGLGVVVFGAASAYALSYLRTLGRIAEEPDIAPAVARARWLPAFGNAQQTAIGQFSVRTLFRSAPHRVILAFYWGMGFAIAIIFLKTPRGQQLTGEAGANVWYNTSVPLLVSSVVMMGFAVLAARLAFAMPRDLRANWIFRIAPIRGGPDFVTARRRALMAVSVVPVSAAAAALFLWMWPWQPAIGHLVALALLGMILVELCLSGTPKIPFTCSYLPGKSRMHIAIYVAVVLLFPLTIVAVEFERDALQNTLRYSAMATVLLIAWIGTWARSLWPGNPAVEPPQFEDETAGAVVTLELWDVRRHPAANGMPRSPTTPV